MVDIFNKLQNGRVQKSSITENGVPGTPGYRKTEVVSVDDYDKTEIAILNQISSYADQIDEITAKKTDLETKLAALRAV